MVTYANAKTTSKARKGVAKAFIVEIWFDTMFLLVIIFTINILKLYHSGNWEGLFKVITSSLIDAYGPISDNVVGFVEMTKMSHCICERTNAFDVVRNSITTIGKGFAIGLAALVSLTIFAIFVSYATISKIVVLTLKVFIGLLVGAMLPHWFSIMIVTNGVENAYLKVVEKGCSQNNLGNYRGFQILQPKILPRGQGILREGHRCELK